MEPKFKHDCSTCCCNFLGHFYGLDVYSYEGGLGPGLLCRYGNEGHGYSSMPLCVFGDSLTNPNHRIGFTDGDSMFYRDFLFSERAGSFERAYLVGAVMLANQQQKTIEKLTRKSDHGCADTWCRRCDE